MWGAVLPLWNAQPSQAQEALGAWGGAFSCDATEHQEEAGQDARWAGQTAAQRTSRGTAAYTEPVCLLWEQPKSPGWLAGRESMRLPSGQGQAGPPQPRESVGPAVCTEAPSGRSRGRAWWTDTE